jgi:acetoin:2,6-dichlorophenolindophenol oxidoreductase subunit beta
MNGQAASARKLTIGRAMQEAMAQAMRADSSVFLMGEDICRFGGVWGHTAGLVEEFGPQRVRDTPISEAGFIGAAAGAAMQGMRPIVELMFVDFVGVCLDAIAGLAAKNHYFTGGQSPVPMVINTAVGGGYSDAGHHSGVLWPVFAHMPGLKVVCPSNAYDAKGLMLASIADDNPVVFMFHKNLQGVGFLGVVKRSVNEVPLEQYTVPIGESAVARTGDDVTIVGVGATVHLALDAAEQLAERGISAEVLDIRTIQPLDRTGICRSAQKTGRLLVVDDDYISYGLTGEVIASVTERAWSALKAAPARIAYPDITCPFSPSMERFALPDAGKIVTAVEHLMESSR